MPMAPAEPPSADAKLLPSPKPNAATLPALPAAAAAAAEAGDDNAPPAAPTMKLAPGRAGTDERAPVDLAVAAPASPLPLPLPAPAAALDEAMLARPTLGASAAAAPVPASDKDCKLAVLPGRERLPRGGGPASDTMAESGPWPAAPAPSAADPAGSGEALPLLLAEPASASAVLLPPPLPPSGAAEDEAEDAAEPEDGDGEWTRAPALLPALS